MLAPVQHLSAAASGCEARFFLSQSLSEAGLEAAPRVSFTRQGTGVANGELAGGSWGLEAKAESAFPTCTWYCLEGTWA